MSIELIVGLGNPGAEYEATRHNAGFWWLESVARANGVQLTQESKFFGRVARLKSPEAWLLTPTTFMNASGQAVGAMARFYRIAPENILIVHDELDLDVGVTKLKKGGGHGGHNGLKDIAAHLGSKDFWRLRLGIGHPGKAEEVINFVLHKPSRDESNMIESAIVRSTGVLPLLLTGEFEAAMLKLHTKVE
ncbi:MAG: aminoacyl-tRNA hydrolase [Methylophilaceae bacterium]